MLIKICGIQTVEDARVAAEAGADMIGLVFAQSSRQVTVDQARLIRQSCTDLGVKVVGVFRNQPIEEVNAIQKAVGLDYVQLHGQESLDDCKSVQAPLIRALNQEDITESQAALKLAEHLLIDSPQPGSGQPFNWETLKKNRPNRPFMLAGGLHKDNVLDAIRTLKPAGVDVSSGVETDRQKDPEKIRQFIETVRTHEYTTKGEKNA